MTDSPQLECICGRTWKYLKSGFWVFRMAPQPQPKQEPVAWMIWTHGPVKVFMNKDEAEMEFDRLCRAYPEQSRKLTPLYTAPQPQRDDTALLRQALEALEKLNKDGWILADFEGEVYAAIAALKERLNA